MGRLSAVATARRSTLAEDALDGLTRAERAILEAHADQIVATERSGDERAARGSGVSELVELGSGTAAKTRMLLDAMARAGALWRYVPFDVDGGMVRDTAAALCADYPGLEVHGVTGDFEHDLGDIPPPEPGHPRVVAFLGGTIGNFTPGSRRRFLRELAARLDDRSFLLLGMRVAAIDLDLEFGRGEELRTEISAKFTPERVRADLGAAGLELVRWLTDPEGLFALSLARRK